MADLAAKTEASPLFALEEAPPSSAPARPRRRRAPVLASDLDEPTATDEPEERAIDLGPSTSRPRALRAHLRDKRATPAEIAAMRALVVETAENRPGVYRMHAENDEIVYVGKSKHVRTRLLSYFSCASHEKGSRIVRAARRIAWEYAPNEFDALLREMRAIHSLRPRFNVAMKRDENRYVFIKVTEGPAPKLRAVRAPQVTAKGSYYGPFSGYARVSEAVQCLSDVLGLRDCADDTGLRFADQTELFPLLERAPSNCHRYEIKRCLGPCVRGCTKAEYAARVRAARAFLSGSSTAIVDELEAQMREASAR
ncbi:hypothetical protein EON77_15300, partial [bacterium]